METTDKSPSAGAPSATPATPAPAPAGAPPTGPRPAGPFRSGPRPGFKGPGGFRPSGPGGARPGPGGRPSGGPGGRFRRPPPRRKVCRFCQEKVKEIDYKAVPVLRGFLSPRGKILAGRTTGACARHQRQLTTAIKRAQNVALLPFTGE